MRKLVWVCGIAVLAACTAVPDGVPAEEPATSVVTSNSFAYLPMGFARISAAGGVVTAFDSTSALAAPVSVTHVPGNYTVTFATLAAPSPLTDATGGNVQVTAEGTNNTRCRVLSWSGSPNLSVSVQCALADGTLADSAFAVLFYRRDMPPPSAARANAAYSWVTASGFVSPFWDYNTSGVHNTVTKTLGHYALRVRNAASINAGMMVTPYGGSAPGAVCSITNWFASGPDVVVNIECKNQFNQLADSAFSFSYATTGPTVEQQGAHAWFNGASADPAFSRALAKLECESPTVTGSPGPVVTMVVSGDLGSWDASPFLRASFASKYGAAGYCKVETLTVVGIAPPTSTATTTIKCYDPTGTAVASPQLTFTHATSDAAGPC